MYELYYGPSHSTSNKTAVMKADGLAGWGQLQVGLLDLMWKTLKIKNFSEKNPFKCNIKPQRHDYKIRHLLMSVCHSATVQPHSLSLTDDGPVTRLQALHSAVLDSLLIKL